MTEQTKAPVRASDDGVKSQVMEAAEAAKREEQERLDALAELPAGYSRVPIALLRLAKRNPRRGAVAEVIESLREFGQHRPVVVQRSTGEVVVGNHLLKAAMQLGWDELDAFVVDDDDDKALRRALADNAVGDKAGWDEQELAEVLKDTGAVPGFEQSEVDKLLAKLEDDIGEKPEPTYPIVPVLNEKYDYVFVFAENETDWAWLETVLELRSEKSYKSSAVGKSHVVTVARLQELLGEKAGG
jgi:hypothetical protein